MWILNIGDIEMLLGKRKFLKNFLGLPHLGKFSPTKLCNKELKENRHYWTKHEKNFVVWDIYAGYG